MKEMDKLIYACQAKDLDSLDLRYWVPKKCVHNHLRHKVGGYFENGEPLKFTPPPPRSLAERQRQTTAKQLIKVIIDEAEM